MVGVSGLGWVQIVVIVVSDGSREAVGMGMEGIKVMASHLDSCI